MTSWPVEENHFAWWLCTGTWRRLHAIPGGAVTPTALRAAIDEAEPLPARAACGLRSGWHLPGMGSRLGLARCGRCCAALGVAAGNGTPANEGALPSAT